MTTPLLSRHRRVATTRLDEARGTIGQSFCPHQLALTRRDGRLDMVHNAATLGRDVTLNYLRYGDEVRIVPGRFHSFYLVQVPLAGRARVRVGDRIVASDTTRGSLGSPTETVDMVWGDGCEQLLVYIRRDAVQALAGGGPDTPPVVFDPVVDLCSPGMRSWLRLVHLAVDDIEAGGALVGSELAATHLEQSLIAALLAAQPNTTSDDAPVSAIGSRAVRLVVAAVQAQPEHPWRLTDLARVAGVSARSLQEAFARYLSITPLEYVRRTRLDRARRDLLDADPTATSVTDIAARWGFFHLGRFSQVYRSAFHELPSQTLAS